MRHAGLLHRSKLSDQLASHLTDLIVDGSFVASQALPAERELAAQFGCSIHVVREALKRLAAIGLVEIRHGAGSFVNPPERWNMATPMLLLVRSEPSSVLDVHDVRVPLEMMAAELAAKLATPADLGAIESALQRMRACVEQHEAFAAADLDFHLALAKATHNRMLWAVLQPLIEPVHECMLRGLRIPIAMPRALAEHEAIATAVRAHSVRQARDAMRRHLETNRLELMNSITPASETGPVVDATGVVHPVVLVR